MNQSTTSVSGEAAVATQPPPTPRCHALGRARNWLCGAPLTLLAAAFVRGQEPPSLPELPRHDPRLELIDGDLLFPQRPGSGTEANAVTVKWSGESVEERGALVVLLKGFLELGELAGDRLDLRADLIEYDRSVRSLRAAGNVLLEHHDFTLRCDRLVVGFGAVGAASGDSRMLGDDAVPSGEAWDVTFELQPSWTLKSAHVAFVSHPGDSLAAVGRLLVGAKTAVRTTVFTFNEASVTPCPTDSPRGPDWIAKTSRLELTVGSYHPASDLRGYATLKNAVLRVRSVPLAWMPWLLYPARIDRSPGLLPPALGYGSTLGAMVGVSYFQPLGETADVTFSPTWYSKEGTMWGTEARWMFNDMHGGSVNARYIKPISTKENRYRVSLQEIWDTERDWRVRTDINVASDQMVDAEFGTKGTLPLGDPTYNSSLFVGKNFRWAALSVFASDQRTFFHTDDVFYHPNFPGSMQKLKLPEGQLRFYHVPIGRFYLDGSAQYGRLGYTFDVDEQHPKVSYYWNRGDGQARLQGMLGQLGPLRADLQLGGRFTYYGAVLNDKFFGIDTSDLPRDPVDNPDFDPFRVEGPAAQRWLASSRLQISAPQFGRSFLNLKVARYRGDLKHIVEPTVAFTFNSNCGMAGAFPRFDETDTRPGVGSSAVGERSVELGLKQHIFGRSDSSRQYADIVRLNASIRYYVAPIILSYGHTKVGWGSFTTSIIVEPSRNLRLSFQRSSEMLGGTADTSVSADMAVSKKSALSLAFFSSMVEQMQIKSRGARMGGGHSFFGDTLRLRYEANYDWERRLFSQSLVSLSHTGRCVEYGVRYQHVALPLLTPLANENRVDFTVSLRNIGELFAVEIGEAIASLFR